MVAWDGMGCRETGGRQTGTGVVRYAGSGDQEGGRGVKSKVRGHTHSPSPFHPTLPPSLLSSPSSPPLPLLFLALLPPLHLHPFVPASPSLTQVTAKENEAAHMKDIALQRLNELTSVKEARDDAISEAEGLADQLAASQEQVREGGGGGGRKQVEVGKRQRG